MQAHFSTRDPVVKRTVDLDMALIDFYQLELNKIERFIEQQALKHNPVHLIPSREHWQDRTDKQTWTAMLKAPDFEKERKVFNYLL